MTLLPSSDHERAHDVARGARADDDDDRFVFPRAVRRGLAAYVAAVVVACVVLAPASLDARGYFDAFLVVSAICCAPGVFIAWGAARRAPHGDRLVWRLWVAGFAIGCVVTVQFLVTGEAGFETVQQRAVASAVVGTGLLVVANTLVLRSRSGQRSVLIDVADIGVAMAAVVAPLVLLLGEQVMGSAARWYALSAAVWFVGALYGTGVAVVLYLRVRPDDRVVARYGVIFGMIALGSSAAQVVIGADDFGLAPGPFLAAHALCTGFGVLFLAHSTRRSSAGLERLPARAQVRRRPGVTLLVLVSIPITGTLVALQRDEDWAVLVALATAGVLVSLFCLRSLLAARETRLLYHEVERSADERAALLTDVLAQAEADRHRVATHLHRQSVQLYAALSTVVQPLGADDDRRTAAERVAEHLRADLGRQSDDLRRFAQAVRPPCVDPGAAGIAPAASLTTLVQVQLDGLYPEGRRPRLVAEVDPDLVLDWTDEAVLVRVAEQAFVVLSTRAPAATVARVRLAVVERDLLLDLLLEGGSPGGVGDAGSGGGGDTAAPLDVAADELAAVRAGAELIGATIEVVGPPDAIGVRVRVPFGRPGPSVREDRSPAGVTSARPALRLVDGR